MGFGAALQWGKRPGGSARTQPLKPLGGSYPDAAGISLNTLKQWLGSDTSLAVRSFFEQYPPHSLVSATSRAVLYYLVRSLKAKAVIEIGTYYAGSAEVITRALWENGEGMLHTFDPHGRRRCPAVIGGWPKPLQKHVRFYPVNSMDFFEEFAKEEGRADMAFIDGNHDYAYAAFDLASAARALTPGGIIVLDNIDQPGPFRAMADFIRRQTEWQEMGESLAGFRADYPFESQKSQVEGTSFALLRAPQHHYIRSAALASGQQAYPASCITKLTLSLAAAAPKGVLHAQVMLRGFALGYQPEERILTLKIPLGGETGNMDIPLPRALRVTGATRMTSREYKAETVLFWQPETEETPLQLLAFPEPFV